MCGGESSDLKRLLTLAWPIVLARATQSVVGFTDALMVSPLGESALAGVTAGALNTFALIIFPMGTVYIVQSFAAQLRGRGDLAGVRRYAWYGLAVALVAGVIAAAMIPLVPRVVARLDYTPEVRAVMVAFMSIRLLSVGPVVANEALANWYGGLGNTRIAMITGTITMMTNVALNYVLIMPRFGLPGWGVVGSATATVIASTLGFAVTAVVFARGIGLEGDVQAASRRGGGRAFRTKELARVVRFGLPNGVTWFFEFAAFIVFLNLVVVRLGTTVVAAFNVVTQINSIGFMPAFGLASSGAILVGESIGRSRHDEVPAIVKLTAKVACAWMGSIAVIYVLAPARLMGLFLSRGESTGPLVAVGTTMLLMATMWQLFDAVGMTLGEALRAAGDTTWPMLARLLIAWLIWTPVGYLSIVVLGGGVVVMMWCLVGYIVLIAGAMAYRFRMGRWRTIEMIEPHLVDA
jgi:MATE family multidrug resistance protein